MKEAWEAWEEYDAAAEWCAKRGIKGEIGDPLPNLMLKDTVDLINADPEAFTSRVRLTAYALSMEGKSRIYANGHWFFDQDRKSKLSLTCQAIIPTNSIATEGCACGKPAVGDTEMCQKHLDDFNV